MTRLLLVEDHILVRQSIRAFLKEADFEVVGEASNGREAVQLARESCPDIILMDIHLPEMNGIEATRQIRRICPDVRIIALTAYNEKAYQRALAALGVHDFVLKTAEFSELLKTIRRYVPSSGGAPVVATTTTQSTTEHRLTEREIEVLRCVAHGWTNKQIGHHLDISARTVQVHLQAIYQKFDVTNRTEAVLRAMTLGILSPMDSATE